MDSFEQVVSEILWRNGYWTQTEFKVELTKEEKRAIDRPSSPRWEIDAYSGAKKELLVVECKSYLDSRGVGVAAFNGGAASKRYKLFNEPHTRDVVLRALREQLVAATACPSDVQIKLCLAAGKIPANEAAAVKDIFEKKGWVLFDSNWLRGELLKLADQGYENQISSVVSKLLLRGQAA